MVILALISRFRRDERGISLLEGLIAFPIVLLTFTALVEFGLAVSQWNQTVKALQLGARLAVVSDPLPLDADWAALTADWSSANTGRATPSTPVTVACGAGANACKSAEMDRLVFGGDGRCDPDYGSSMAGVCDFNWRMGRENLRVSYHRSGLGYVGRPDGPVVTVTVEAVDLTFDLFFLGVLLGINTLEIPAMPVSMTSEDLNSDAP